MGWPFFAEYEVGKNEWNLDVQSTELYFFCQRS